MKTVYRRLYGVVPVSEYPSDLLQGGESVNVASESVKEQNREEEAALTVGTKQLKSGESELFLRAKKCRHQNQWKWMEKAQLVSEK